MLGYDMGTDPVLRAAMEEARDKGAPVASGKVALQAGDGIQHPGFVMFLPLYRYGAPLRGNAVDDRRLALVGYVFSPCRVDKLVESAAPREMRDVKVEVYDGRAVASDALLYDSAPAVAATGRFLQTTLLELGGQAWTLRFSATPAWEAAVVSNQPRMLLLAGGLISLLLAVAGWSFSVTRSHSKALERVNLALTSEVAERRRAEDELKNQQDHLEDLVRERTAELTVAEEKYRGIFENAVEGIFQTTPDGRLITANPALARMRGFDSVEEMIAATTNIAHHVYVEPDRREEFKRILEEREQRAGVRTRGLSPRRQHDVAVAQRPRRPRCHGSGALLRRQRRGHHEPQAQRGQRPAPDPGRGGAPASRGGARRDRGSARGAQDLGGGARGKQPDHGAPGRDGRPAADLRDLRESRKVAATQLQRIFESDDGALYLLEPAHGRLALAASWGRQAPAAELFGPDDCWAMRLGRPYTVEADAGGHIATTSKPKAPPTPVCRWSRKATRWGCCTSAARSSARSSRAGRCCTSLPESGAGPRQRAPA